MNAEQKLAKIQELVNLQAEDEALWICNPNYTPTLTALEACLQQELRRLHAAVEARSLKEIDDLIRVYKE